MAASRAWDDEALSKAYEGLVVGLSHMKADHPNPKGYLTLCIRRFLLARETATRPYNFPTSLSYDPVGQSEINETDYIIEAIAETGIETHICYALLAAYSTREIALQLGISHSRVCTIRKSLQERLTRVLT